MGPGMEDSVDSRKAPLCGSLWCPMDSRLHGNDEENQSPRSHGFPSFSQNAPVIPAKRPRHSRTTPPVIPAKAGIHKGAPVMKHPRSTSRPTNPTECSTYRRDQQPEKRARVAGVPSVDTNRALISSRRYQSMCFDNLINSWFMSCMFSRRTLNRSS